MKRAYLDIDNKVLAGLIVGALTYALTKLAVPVDAQAEQAINVGAALLAAYLMPSKTPSALTGEADEGDDVPEPPTARESESIPVEPVYADEDFDPSALHIHRGNGHGATTITQADAIEEHAHYGRVNQVTGLTAEEVESELDLEALAETDDDEE